MFMREVICISCLYQKEAGKYTKIFISRRVFSRQGISLVFNHRRRRTHQVRMQFFVPPLFGRHGSISRLFRRRRALQAAAPRFCLSSLAFNVSHRTRHNGGVIRFVRPRTNSTLKKKAGAAHKAGSHFLHKNRRCALNSESEASATQIFYLN